MPFRFVLAAGEMERCHMSETIWDVISPQFRGGCERYGLGQEKRFLSSLIVAALRLMHTGETAD